MNNMEKWRKAVNLSQVALAEACGWKSQSRISNYENGIREPGLQECRIIVTALRNHGADCSLDDVFPPLPLSA